MEMSTATRVQNCNAAGPGTTTTNTTETIITNSTEAAKSTVSATSANKSVAAPVTATAPGHASNNISLILEHDVDVTLSHIGAIGGDLNNEDVPHTTATSSLANSGANVDAGECRNSPALLERPVFPPTPPDTPPIPQTKARKRWRILAKVLRKDSEETMSSSGEDEERAASVRRFKSFDLLRQDSFEDHVSLSCLGKPDNWYKYRVLLGGEGRLEYSVNIHHIDRQLTANDLIGFNNTGNICIWPSEEALTAVVLAEMAAYRGKWILELGGGFTCLSGLMLSKYAKPYAVHLTDGNEMSVENVKKTVCLNELSCYTKCSVLKWEDVTARSPAEAAKFDAILSADCLFFDEARTHLIDTIWYYLAPRGVALVMAPRRGKTLSLFVEQCGERGFRVEVTQRYNETIWQRHLELQHSELYDEDLHYPMLIQLRKPLEGTDMATDCD